MAKKVRRMRGVERRKEIYQCILEFKTNKGYPPTLREIAIACGISGPSVVRYHLGVMRDDGVIDFQDAIPRSINITGVPIE